MQEILIMSTTGQGLRSEAFGWSHEYPSVIEVSNKPIGLSGINRGPYPSYDCPLRALADGWHLLAPPSKNEEGWEWWLVRNIDEH